MNTDEIRALLHSSAMEITRLKEAEKQLLRERGELLADRRRLEWWIKLGGPQMNATRPLDDDPDRRTIYWISGSPLGRAREFREALDLSMRT